MSIALLRRSDEITLKRYALRISLVEQLDFARHTQSAKQTESRECYDTIDDCEYYFCNGKCVSKCPIGQKLDASGYCVKEWCYDNFLCPANYRVTASYNDFNDCACKYGYYKYGNYFKSYKWCFW